MHIYKQLFINKIKNQVECKEKVLQLNIGSQIKPSSASFQGWSRVFSDRNEVVKLNTATTTTTNSEHSTEFKTTIYIYYAIHLDDVILPLT